MTAAWELQIGDLTTRRQVWERYGGGRQGGIEPSNASPNVFLYSDPSQGERHGYDYDGWSDGPQSPVYYYTGEGRLGDQQPDLRGNGAILRHAEAGRSLRLFEAVGGKQPGGKRQRYVGEFYLDQQDPWTFRQARDGRGELRHVVVFKLRAVDVESSRSASRAGTVAAPAETEVEYDERTLREVALVWLERRTDGGRQALTFEDLGDFPGGYPLADHRARIWQPEGFSAVLSIRDSGGVESTNVVENGLRVRLPDGFPTDGMEAAVAQRLPLVSLHGVGAGRYLAVFPLYAVGKEGESFLLVADETFGRVPDTPDSPLEEAVKRYVKAETKRRLHQPIFRARVLRAYDRRCAVCSLAHVELLDAAHIVPDSEEEGVPTVQNGLAMCKLHHSAYDALILGVTPEYTIEVAQRILDEVDGPTLKHAIQERHGTRLMVLPSLQREWPDPALLARQYAKFRAAGQ